VTILSGGPQSPPPLDLLREGKADFATLWLSTGIQALAQGLNPVNIGFITDLPKQNKPPVSSKPVMGQDQPDKGAAGI